MTRFVHFVLLSLITSGALFAQSSKSIKGRVVAPDGNPLVHVNVFIKNFYQGDVTDAGGYFEIHTNLTGPQVLIASMIGFKKHSQKIELNGLLSEEIQITLREKAISMPEATITASSFSSGDEKGVTLRRLEVLTTPGAAADILLAIKTFPGLAHIDEGSGLFVRGGDVSETLTILDQATVVHPYRYESPTGGTFGTITPFLVEGTFFSSGGFSAKYGNALSGILAMESLDRPVQSQYTVNVGLAATSAGIDVPINDKVGLRFSGNRSSTGLMFRFNGRYSEFTEHPRGTDGNFNVTYNYSTTGRIKFFTFLAETQIGVKVDQPSFDGVFSSDETNQLYNLQWSEVVGNRLFMQASLSLNNYRTRRNLGVFDLNQKDQAYKFRLDAERDFGSQFKLNFGIERELLRNNFNAVFPKTDVLDPNAESIIINQSYNAHRNGIFIENDLQVARGLFLKYGIRVDHHDLASQVVADPRVSLFYQVNNTSNLRASWGIYHQFPAPLFYTESYGNPALKTQAANHYILGYEYAHNDNQIRAEIYYKQYDDLVIESEEVEFVNDGYGYARGFDLFMKRGVLLNTKFSGWLSYSFLESKRLQGRETRNGLVNELASSSFDITHNLTVVGKYSFSNRISAGLTFRYATGRPFTPVIDSEPHAEFEFYIPFEGPVNSERLPNYYRLDSSLSYMLPFKNNYAIFYVALSNILNRQNVIAYDYSFDYSERIPRPTNFSRFIYFGTTITFR